jgi:hypothetical protein
MLYIFSLRPPFLFGHGLPVIISIFFQTAAAAAA